MTVSGATKVAIEFVGKEGAVKVLKKPFALQDKEIIDTSVMSKKALIAFFEKEIADAKAQDVLFSLHMKATMMKVSDPVIFGHAVKVYYKAVFDKYGQLFDQLGVDVNNGLGDVYAKFNRCQKRNVQKLKRRFKRYMRLNPLWRWWTLTAVSPTCMSQAM